VLASLFLGLPVLHLPTGTKWKASGGNLIPSILLRYSKYPTLYFFGLLEKTPLISFAFNHVYLHACGFLD
jgi:hypothetical protein